MKSYSDANIKDRRWTLVSLW